MPLPHSVATKLGKTRTVVRKDCSLWWLRPDGETQVTIEYVEKADGSVQPQKIHTMVTSTQQVEPMKATRSKECAGYMGAKMTASSMEEMNKLIVEKVGGEEDPVRHPTKETRSAACICRQMTKLLVKSGLCKRAQVQLSYAIGVAKPLSLFLGLPGTEQGALLAQVITNAVKIEFDCRPGANAKSLEIREP